MRSRRPSPEHEEAVARRLAALVAEIEATRPGVGEEYADPALELATESVDELVTESVAEQVDEQVDDLDECETTVVRLPGRHAARRGLPVGLAPVEDEDRDGWWSRGLRHASAWALAPAHLAVVAALVAGGLALTCWWLVASGPQPQPVAAPVPLVDGPGDGASRAGATSAGASSSSGEGTSGEGAAAAQVVVDVAGKVRRPGIVVLPAGSRVADALEAAGGARRGVDLTALNLARLLVDGEQVLVGVEPPGGVASGAVSGTGPGPTTTLVNINTADRAGLETLPGVGPVTADAIIAWRTENGGFRSVDDLLDVSGIGEATLAKLAPLVTV